jgi:DNA helicase HerA-like ATPase
MKRRRVKVNKNIKDNLLSNTTIGTIKKINIVDYNVLIVQSVKDINFLYRYDANNDVFVKNGHVNSYVYSIVESRIIVMKIVEQDIINQSVMVKANIIGYIEGGKFVNSYLVVPIIGSECYSASYEITSIIFELNDKDKIAIGQDLENDLVNVNVDRNSFFISHYGIFGVTGSGKSNTLAKFLNMYISELKNKDKSLRPIDGRVVLFDLNSEYENKIFTDNNIVEYKKDLSNNKLLYNFELFAQKIMGDLVSLDSEINNRFIAEITKEFLNFKHGDKKPLINMLLLCQTKYDYQFMEGFLFINSFFRFIDLVTEFDLAICDEISMVDFKERNNLVPWSKTVIASIEARIKNRNDISDENIYLLFVLSYLIKSKKGKYMNLVEPLIQRITVIVKMLINNFENSKKIDIDSFVEKFFDGKSLISICLDDKNDLDKDLIISIITSSILLSQRANRSSENTIRNVINIVVDEAHNVLGKPSQVENEDVFSTELIFNRIIKEGRKEGVYLTIATQMPSQISGTILSQLQNFVIHRLINENDIKSIPNSLISSNHFKAISKLNTGEVIVFGQAFSTSRMMRVEQLDSNSAPNSQNIKVF